MSFFKRLANRITRPVLPSGRAIYTLTVQCNRCGEQISAPVDLRNDLSLADEESTAGHYICRKLLMGRNRCFQQIEVTLHFDDGHRLIANEVSGGKFIEPAAAD